MTENKFDFEKEFDDNFVNIFGEYFFSKNKIKQLTEQYSDYKNAELKKENNKLRTFCESLEMEQIDILVELNLSQIKQIGNTMLLRIKQLKSENEQLKQSLKQYIKITTNLEIKNMKLKNKLKGCV